MKRLHALKSMRKKSKRKDKRAKGRNPILGRKDGKPKPKKTVLFGSLQRIWGGGPKGAV